MSKTITIEIPAPPDGWLYENRIPKKDEEYLVFVAGTGTGWAQLKAGSTFAPCPSRNVHAYRIRDEYAERYEALKLPDGWAFLRTIDGVEEAVWQERFHMYPSRKDTLRRIVNGKAVKP